MKEAAIVFQLGIVASLAAACGIEVHGESRSSHRYINTPEFLRYTVYELDSRGYKTQSLASDCINIDGAPSDGSITIDDSRLDAPLQFDWETDYSHDIAIEFSQGNDLLFDATYPQAYFQSNSVEHEIHTGEGADFAFYLRGVHAHCR